MTDLSVFHVIAHDEQGDAIRARKTSVACKQRLDARYAKWLAQSDFEDRWSYVEDEVRDIITATAEEFGYTGNIKHIVSAYHASVRPRETTKTAAVHEARLPRMCPFHKDVVEISLAAGDPRAGFDSMAQHWGGPRHCEGDGYKGESCKFKAPMATQSYWDERKEQADQRRQERAEREIEQAQEEIRNEEITEPIDPAGGDSLELVAPAEESGDSVEAPEIINDPAEGGEFVAEVPMAMAASIKESEYKYVKKQGNKWVIIQKGTGKVLSRHSSEEEAKAAFRAMEMNMHGGSVKEADGGPSPKMDKRKWTPDAVKRLNVDDADGRWPTKHKDILEPMVSANGDELTEIGKPTTERQDVEKDSNPTDGGGSGQSELGPRTGPATAVASTGNPLDEILENPDGFLSHQEIQAAIAKHQR